MDLMEVDVLDPHPDIHELFCYYNALYFEDILGACLVTWSSGRMTLCAGTCRYMGGGSCEIRLSEPLLKFRSSIDLKNTLLHEMIHAYLFIKYNNRDHGSHGNEFQNLMKKINCSTVVDYQRPPGGYGITIYHNFFDEVDSYRVHHWMCNNCGDLVKRAMNREPSPNDCIQRLKEGQVCNHPSCHWHSPKDDTGVPGSYSYCGLSVGEAMDKSQAFAVTNQRNALGSIADGYAKVLKNSQPSVSLSLESRKDEEGGSHAGARLRHMTLEHVGHIVEISESESDAEG
ncbi:SprT-like domain-containing protein Spartan [Nymphaea thermarum]|nr:SprT-like domain-containing protein Spartan [Nymphaea thermarum]